MNGADPTRRGGPRTLALLGSGEFEPWAEPVDRRVLSAARPGPVAVVPTASWPDGRERFEAWGRKGAEHYRRLGREARVVPLRTREDAFHREPVEAIAGASLIFFSGGRPSYLAEVLAATPFWRALLGELEDGAAYGGCSAGACVVGEMAPDDVTEKLFAPDWAPGLRLVPGIVITPHWDTLDEHEPGMREFAEAQVPEDCALLAIDEQTAVVGDGAAWQVVGVGAVRIGRAGQWRRHREGERFALPARVEPGVEADRRGVSTTEPTNPRTTDPTEGAEHVHRRDPRGGDDRAARHAARAP